MWYHGGIAGIPDGGWLLPATDTGLWLNSSPDNPRHQNRVYITDHIDVAEHYAGLLPEYLTAAVYQVAPIGEIREDETDGSIPLRKVFGDIPVKQFYCSRAKVLQTLKVLTDNDHQQLRQRRRNTIVKSIGLLALLALFGGKTIKT